MKHRLERVKELIKRELGSIITRDISFAAALVTVHAVDITPDLKNAHIFISAIGAPEQCKQAIAELQKHRVELQRALSKRVILKYTPHLHFKLDESIERGSRIIELLNEIEEPTDET